MPHTTISTEQPLITLINIFTCDPDKQAQLVQAWQRSTDEVICHLPGFISANVHRSLDGTKVVNYAQWQSRQAFMNMLTDPAARDWLDQLAELGTPDPVLCQVVSVHHA